MLIFNYIDHKFIKIAYQTQLFSFNKPVFLSFALVPMSCTFVSSMKDNGAKMKRSGNH